MFDSRAVEERAPGPELAQAHLEAQRYQVLASFAEASPLYPTARRCGGDCTG